MEKEAKQKKDWFFGTSQNLPKIVEIDLAKITPNPNQPRKTFKEESIRELADSIALHGLIQPITVMRDKDSDRYLLVTGERRFRAHQMLNRETIFSVILTSGNSDELALIENIQREDLNAIEEAQALANLMTRYSYTQEQLGKVIGKAQNTISTTLRLNTLPDQIKHEYPTSDNVSKSVLVEIARHDDPEQQIALWEMAKSGGITVRHTRTAKQSNPQATIAARPRRAAKAPIQQTLSLGRVFLERLEAIGPEALATDGKDGSEVLQVCAQIRDRYYVFFPVRDTLMDLAQQLDHCLEQSATKSIRLKKNQIKKIAGLQEKLNKLLADQPSME